MNCLDFHKLPPPGSKKKGWPWAKERTPLAISSDSPLPKVSIVTPSYNQANFLEETIRSVLLQNYPNLEYIIIDGGSNDGSVNIIRKYEPWLSYWKSEPDRGQSQAINQGWAMSTGNILAYLNSDDTYEPKAVQKVINFLREHPHVDTVYGDCNKIDEVSKVTGMCSGMPFDLKAIACGQWYIPQPSVFIRSQVIKSIGNLAENLHLVMDWMLWLHIALAGFKIVYLPQTLANFRVYKLTKTSSQFKRAGKEKLLVLDNLFQDANLPADIQLYKPQAYSNVYRVMGLCAYDQIEMPEARSHLWHSLLLDPASIKEPKVFWSLTISCLGNRLYRYLSAVWKGLRFCIRRYLKILCKNEITDLC